jgi:hypothetical protein
MAPPLFDRVFVAPTPAELADVLDAAAAHVNETQQAPSGPAPLKRPLPGLARALARLVADADGCHYWPHNAVVARLLLAWWRDFAGRLHARVAGRPAGRDDAPPLTLIYPRHTLVRRRADAAEALAVCPRCGAAGEVRSLGWMGERCGPCHDRGDAAPQGWPPATAGDVTAAALAGPLLAVRRRAGPAEVWDVPGRRRLASLAGVGPGGGRLGLSADGRIVADVEHVSEEGLYLCVWETAAGRRLARLPIDQGARYALAPDGGFVVTPHAQRLVLTRLDDGPAPEWQRRPVRAERLVGLALSPDGARLAVARPGQAPSLDVWGVPERRVLTARALPGEPASSPAFTADGRLVLAVRVERRPAPLALAEPLRGRAVVRLPARMMGLSGAPALRPDGAAVAACDPGGRLHVWALPGAGGEAVPLADARGVGACGWLPDGSLVAFGREAGVVNVWPAETFRP